LTLKRANDIHGAPADLANQCLYAIIPIGKNQPRNHLSSLLLKQELPYYADVAKQQPRLTVIKHNAKNSV
jgi:hypothetical protein